MPSWAAASLGGGIAIQTAEVTAMAVVSFANTVASQPAVRLRVTVDFMR
jgi:hypothetical protein